MRRETRAPVHADLIISPAAAELFSGSVPFPASSSRALNLSTSARSASLSVSIPSNPSPSCPALCRMRSPHWPRPPWSYRCRRLRPRG